MSTANADAYDVDGAQALVRSSESTDPAGKLFGAGSTKIGKTKTGWSYDYLLDVVKVYCRPRPRRGHARGKLGQERLHPQAGQGPQVLRRPEFIFTDAGEPGTKDRVRLLIKDKNGAIVLNVDEKLDCGNQQALNLPPV